MMKRKKEKNTSFRPWQAVEKSSLPIFPTALSLDKLVTCIEFQYHFYRRGSFSWMACINYGIMNIMGNVMMMNEGYKKIPPRSRATPVLHMREIDRHLIRRTKTAHNGRTHTRMAIPSTLLEFARLFDFINLHNTR
jgi:hypothetical protein